MGAEKRHRIRKICVITTLSLCLVLLCIGLISDYHEQTKRKRLIENIETLKKQQGRLPDLNNTEEMLALGFELRVGWYPEFKPLNATDYELWLYTGFDGPYEMYSSQSRTWQESF